MEIVNTLNIDGTQWEMQDAKARNKIVEIEQKTQENTNAIQNINKNIAIEFKASDGVKIIKMYPFEACLISGFIQRVGPYMAIIAAESPSQLKITDLYSSVSSYLGVKPLGNFQYELILDGPIFTFGKYDSAS